LLLSCLLELEFGTTLEHLSKFKYFFYQDVVAFSASDLIFSNTKPNSQPFAVEAIIAGTQKTSGSIENCLTWCFNNFGCSLCSISDGGVSRLPFGFNIRIDSVP